MKGVKNPVLFAISMIFLVVIVGLVIERFLFLSVARRVDGTVSAIHARNDRCGGKRKYDCTKFSADVTYVVREESYRQNVTAGSRRGHNNPAEDGQYRTGDVVRIVYDPRKPGKSYRDTFIDIWGTPIMFLFFQVSMFIGSFREKRGQIYDGQPA